MLVDRYQYEHTYKNREGRTYHNGKSAKMATSLKCWLENIVRKENDTEKEKIMGINLDTMTTHTPSIAA